jgi:hypothetical protein
MRAQMMIDQRDFIPKTLSKHWLKGVQTESFDAAIVAANDWIDAENIDVINVETVVLPMAEDDETETSSISGVGKELRQFIRIWYRCK